VSERITLDDALALLRTWRDDRTLLRCQLNAQGCVVIALVRVESIRDADIVLRSDDQEAVIAIPITTSSEWLYWDTRHVPELTREYGGALTLALTAPPDFPPGALVDPFDDAAETVTLMEMRDPRAVSNRKKGPRP
jgi:hypothetical protein